VIASAFADVGFDVDIGPLFATADEAARQAVENDVHILGVSSLAAAHLTAVPELKAALKKHGREDIMIIIGGVVPPQDYDALYKAGAEAIFPPGTVICGCRRGADPQAQRAARPQRGGGVAPDRSVLTRRRRPSGFSPGRRDLGTSFSPMSSNACAPGRRTWLPQ
jgi:methylmalonyl-CoA mutase cobalamin-binding domain/chain